MAGTPHGIVGQILDGVVDGGQSIGEQLMGVLDSPLQGAGLPIPGPHRVVDRGLDGMWDGTQRFGAGIQGALSVPVEALGIPPDLGGGAHSLGGGAHSLGGGAHSFGSFRGPRW